MALVPLRKVLDHAAENGYGVAAFNVNNMEQIQLSSRRRVVLDLIRKMLSSDT